MNDQSPDRLDGLRAEYANTGMVKYDGAVWLISQVVVLRERLAAAVSVPPSADQTALRDRIADAIHRDLLAHRVRRDLGLLGIVPRLADAVLAVLPEQTNQTAVRGVKAEAILLRFAAEAHRRKWSYDRGIDDDGVPIKSEAFVALHRLGEEMRVALEKLRRVAAEEQPAETWDTPDARPGTTDRTLTHRQQSADTKAAAAPGHIVIGEIACAMSNPAHSGPCIPWGHSGPGVAPAVGEQPAETRQSCACGQDGCEYCDVDEAVGEQPETQEARHLGGRANAEDCPACTGAALPYPWICPGPDADATQQPETQEAWPSRHRWGTETLDNVTDEWAPGMRFTDRAVALERYQAISAQYPLWKDGARVRRRFVRETTSYTVEAPE